jgi:hypothetical protein
MYCRRDIKWSQLTRADGIERGAGSRAEGSKVRCDGLGMLSNPRDVGQRGIPRSSIASHHIHGGDQHAPHIINMKKLRFDALFVP